MASKNTPSRTCSFGAPVSGRKAERGLPTPSGGADESGAIPVQDRRGPTKQTLIQFSRARARGPSVAGSDDPQEAALARLLASLEAGLRKQGFTERTIQKHREANRARIATHLTKGERDGR